MFKEKTVSSNRVYLPLAFVISSLVLELANFLFFNFTYSDGSRMIIPTYFLFDIAIILMLAGVIFVVQKKVAMNIFFFFFIFLQVALNIVNTTLYGIFGDILSYDLLKLGAEATTAITADLISWWGVAINLSIFAVIILVVVLLQKHNKSTIKIKNFSVPVIVLAGFIACQSFGVTLFELQKNGLAEAQVQETEIESSDEYLWNNFQFKIDAYKKFGHFGFYAQSIMNLIFPYSELSESDYISFIDNGAREGNSSAPLYGDNLIVILCESLDWYAIDPQLTPNLWNIAHGQDSVVFTQFYARNRTNISEGITLLGNIPRNVTLSDALKAGYNFDWSLPKLFEASSEGESVKTTYVHENYESFYSRGFTHGNTGIGFDEVLTYEDYNGEYNFEWEKWIPDYEISSYFMDDILPTDVDRFLTYYATISTHGPYEKYNPNFEYYYEILDANWENLQTWMNENTDFIFPQTKEYQQMLYYYKAGAMDFDRMIGNLIQEMKQRNLYDNTSILFFADHNAYYSNLCYKMKGVEKSDFSNLYINNIPCMIWSPHLTQTVDEWENTSFCNTYDLLPTICDLYGLKANTNLFQGHSIFSEDIQDSIFVSNLSGIFNNKIFSMNISDIITDNASQEEIDKFKKNANNFYLKQEKIEWIYKYGINGNIKLTDESF